MTRTVYRTIGAKRHSPRPRRVTNLSIGSYDQLAARLDAAGTRLRALRRRPR
jgi:hypothetical protein